MGLVFPEGINFDCGSCTRCCRGWSVHVDERSYRQVKGSPLYQRLEQEDGAAPIYFEDPEQGESTACTRMKNGACVFLGSDRLCMIHREMGVGAKPFGCTMFPFLMRPTPDGVYVGVSFYCSAVQANSGRPLHEHAGELQRALDTHRFPAIPEMLPLDEAKTIPWRLYRRIEEASLHTLRETHDLREGLWQASMRILLLSSVLRGKQSDPERAWDLVSRCRVERDEIFRSLETMFLTGLIGVIDSADPAQCRANTEAVFHRRVLVGESMGTVDLQYFDDFRTRFDAAWSTPELRRFLEHLLFRKFLAYKRNLTANAAAWYLTLPTLEWYRDLSAYAAHRLQPGPEDVLRALDVVERSFTLHARHMDVFFQELPRAFGKMLDEMPELTEEGSR